MKALASIIAALSLLVFVGGCGNSDEADKTTGNNAGGDTHTHADGSTHDDHADDAAAHDHAHDEVDLDPVTIGSMRVELAQGHGAVEAGAEGHLVVKLPYNDNGATIVRAWIGGADRTMSMVGVGEYAPSHDDYDIHAMAPDPLPANTRWWIEIEKPDGTKVVGSAMPIMGAGNTEASEDHDHAHDEVDLDPATIGGMRVELAQGHGAVSAGQEGHLVVKLPYNDKGATIVRAWIGTEDRTMSMVGVGEYAPSHDDYDIHAMAPDPMPADAMWWIEIEKPDGTKVVGSVKPIME